MKKNVSLLSFLFITCMLMAQKSYVIYDWKGQVFLKEYKSKHWDSVQKNQAVSGLDSISIEPKGAIRLMDSRTNLIYKSTETGKMRILNIINEAKKQNSRTLAAVNQQYLNGIKNASALPNMQVVGATTRLLIKGDSTIEDSIISTFGWLANQVQENKRIKNASDLILIKHTTPDGIYFEIRNLSEMGFFINILHLNKQSKKLNLCYIIEEELESDTPFMYLPNGETILLTDLLFNYDISKDIFILIGTEDGYVPEQIQNALQYFEIETGQPLYHRYKFFKL